jgi:hypothetical protein
MALGLDSLSLQRKVQIDEYVEVFIVEAAQEESNRIFFEAASSQLE